MALVTTFATTPLTRALYPPTYQRKLEAWKRGEIDWDSGAPLFDGSRDSEVDVIAKQKLESSRVKSLLIYLRLDSMPTLLAFVSLFGARPHDFLERKHPLHGYEEQESQRTSVTESKRPVDVHGVRLVELTDRTSAVMKVSEMDEYSAFDPVLNAFRVLGQLYNLAVSGQVSVGLQSSYAESLVTRAAEESSDLLLLPWSETGSMSEEQTISKDSVRDKMASDAYSTFVAKALDSAECNVAVFVNKGFSGTLKHRPSTLTRRMSALSVRSSHREHLTTSSNADRSHHIFMPFFGGADGRVALRLVLQLAENPEVTATIVDCSSSEDGPAVHQTVVPKDSRVGRNLPQRTNSDEDDAAFFATLQRSMSSELEARVVFETASTPALDAVQRAAAEVGQNPKNGGDIVVVGRTGPRSQNEACSRCLGFAANQFLESGIRTSLLVVQARGGG